MIHMTTFEDFVVTCSWFHWRMVLSSYGMGWFHAYATGYTCVHSNVGAKQNIISPRLATLYLNINGKFCFK